jgi:hypothetical protein
MRWLLILILSPVLCFAKWKDFGDRKATVRLGAILPTLDVETKPRQPLAPINLKYKPHVSTRTFVSLAYDWWGITASKINPTKPEDEALNGTTQSSDYQFRFYFKKLAAEAYYQKYLGYYIENTQDVVPGWTPNQQKRLLPDMSTEHIGASFTYVFDPDSYSMSAAFDQSAKQTESGGSWLLNFSASDHHIENFQPLIPTELASSYGEYSKIQKAKLLSFSLGFGGGYNYILFEDFYFSVMAILNSAHQILRYEKTDSTGSLSKTGAQGHVKLGLGYNADYYIIGVYVINNSASYLIENVETVFNTAEVSTFLGTRFRF